MNSYNRVIINENFLKMFLGQKNERKLKERNINTKNRVHIRFYITMK